MNKQEIEKAIETLKKYHDLLLEVYADYSVYSKAENYSDKSLELASRANTVKNAVGTAITHMSQQLTNGWILVSERLPEEPSQRVLVTLKNGMVLEVWYINNDFKYHESLSRGGLEKISEFNPVIAWQPLLEPYKEVSE